jgi:hypothetical protein
VSGPIRLSTRLADNVVGVVQIKSVDMASSSDTLSPCITWLTRVQSDEMQQEAIEVGMTSHRLDSKPPTCQVLTIP